VGQCTMMVRCRGAFVGDGCTNDTAGIGQKGVGAAERRLDRLLIKLAHRLH